MSCVWSCLLHTVLLRSHNIVSLCKISKLSDSYPTLLLLEAKSSNVPFQSSLWMLKVLREPLHHSHEALHKDRGIWDHSTDSMSLTQTIIYNRKSQVEEGCFRDNKSITRNSEIILKRLSDFESSQTSQSLGPDGLRSTLKRWTLS